MTNYISSDFNFSALMSGFRDNLENNVQTFIPQLGAFDIVIPPNEFFYYDMRGIDVDCMTPTYRYWTVRDTPDTTGALYYGTKCGATPLSNICIIRRYIASYVELVIPAPIIPIPNAAFCLAMYKRIGPFWQDVAGTVPATTTGDPVKRWDDSSGNGKHATWSSGNVPTLGASGGIVMPVGGAQLEANVTTGGSTTWTMYQRATDANTSDLGWSWVTGNPGTPSTGIAPSYSTGTQMAMGLSGAYNTSAGADTGLLKTRGLAVSGVNYTAFIDSGTVSSTGIAASFSSMRIGTNGGTFSFTGEIINTAIYSTYDTSPTTRADVIAYLLTE